MLKPYLKRSQFINVSTSSRNTPVQVTIEADEVYITQVQPSGAPAQVRRQRERDLQNFLDKNPTLNGTGVATWGTIDPAYGRVNLDNPFALNGSLTNRPVTTTAGDVTQGDRNYNTSTGMKEIVEFRSATEGQTINCVIELVQYIPVELVAA